MTAEPSPVPTEPGEPFVHLHTHTEYSLLDGAAQIGELVDTVKQLGQPALAITDHGVLYGAVEFHAAAMKAGITPIIGCETYMAQRSRHQKETRVDRDPFHLVLLARNATGYRNLVKLVSTGHLEGFYQKPRIDKELLGAHAEGILCLSACIGGELPQTILNKGIDAAESVVREHQEMFGVDNYYLELQNHGIPEEATTRPALAELARRTGAPLVCTNDSHYVQAADAEAHDILLCLQTQAKLHQEKRFRFHGPQFYINSGTDMRGLFPEYGEAIANTVALARRCEPSLVLDQTLLPRYSPIPEGLDADSYLRELCEQGLRTRYGEPTEEARQRLAMELGVIGETGFAAYFLIVWDFIRAAKCEEVRVGPGRGSAAGSLVAYVLGITDVCPLRYGLIFERFLNRERVSMPDIDIDFDDRRRDRVISYVQEKYGRDRVSQIVTFGTMAARAAIRDVGRVLDEPLANVDRLAKLVPQSIGITLEKALDNAEMREVYDGEEWARRIIDNARRLEGICRNASTHAAAVVIAPEPLTNIVPLQRSPSGGDMPVTQFDMNGVQKVGLLKMDFLGLTNLSVIGEALENIAQTHGPEELPDIVDIPLDDGATYALLGRADTYGVFQMEGGGAKKVLLDMQPACLEDVSAAGALNRPGPIEGGVIDLYMKQKRGDEPISYPPGLDALLGPILQETHGTILYQDQVMKIAQAVAGFTLGEADILRAAMGKKNKAKMAEQSEKFRAGAVARGIDERVATELYDLIAFFAGYGFNKAHAVCYGLITYQTAYLKANYCLEYMAALLNSKAGDFDKLKATILDCHAHSLTVVAPDVNRSRSTFSVGDVEKREILYGLSHIKNVGEKVIDNLVASRDATGEFRSLLDLCMRVGRDCNRRVLEALICSGSCDALGERAALMEALGKTLDRAGAIRRERESGQTSLFGLVEPTTDSAMGPEISTWEDLDALPKVTPATEADRLAWERDLLGMYLSDNPLRRRADDLRSKADTTIGELGAHLDGLQVQVTGAVRDVRAIVPKRSTNGQHMAFVQIEDLTGACEVVVFARTYEGCASELRLDKLVAIRGKVEIQRAFVAPSADEALDVPSEGEPVKIIAEAVYGIDDPALMTWRANQTVRLSMRSNQLGLIDALKAALQQHGGEAPVVLHLESPTRVDDVELANDFAVDPCPPLERAVNALLGEGAYRVEVKRDRASVREARRGWKK